MKLIEESQKKGSRICDDLPYQKSLFSSPVVLSTGINKGKVEKILSDTSSLFLGDAKKILDQMRDESVQCVIT